MATQTDSCRTIRSGDEKLPTGPGTALLKHFAFRTENRYALFLEMLWLG